MTADNTTMTVTTTRTVPSVAAWLEARIYSYADTGAEPHQSACFLEHILESGLFEEQETWKGYHRETRRLFDSIWQTDMVWEEICYPRLAQQYDDEEWDEEDEEEASYWRQYELDYQSGWEE